MGGFEKELDQGVTRAATKAGKKAGDQLDKSIGGRFKQLQSKLHGTSGAIATGLGLGGPLGLAVAGVSGLVNMMADAGREASNLAETQSKLSAVFPTQAEEIRKWGAVADKTMGLATQQALEAVGTFGNFLQAMGQTEPVAAEMSKTMVQLAADLGSFNNANPDEVLLALRSGLSGETEPLRRFGVDISDAAVTTELLAQGVEKVGKTFTQTQKIQGRYALIMRQTTTAQNDYSRTASGTANSTKSQAATVANLTAKFGTLVNQVQNTAINMAGGGALALSNVLDTVAHGFTVLQDVIDPTRVEIREMETALEALAKQHGLDPALAKAFPQMMKAADEAVVAEKHRQEALEGSSAAIRESASAMQMQLEAQLATLEASKDLYQGSDESKDFYQEQVDSLKANIAAQKQMVDTGKYVSVALTKAEQEARDLTDQLNWLASVMDLGARSGVGFDGIMKVITNRMVSTGDSFEEALGAVGTAINDPNGGLASMGADAADVITGSYITAWNAAWTATPVVALSEAPKDKLSKAIVEAAEEAKVEVASLPALVTSVMEKVAGKKPGKFVWKERITTAITETRQAFRAALRAINHMLDNPDLGDRSRTALEKRLETLNKKAEEAKKAKNWMAYERTQQEIAKINDELDELNGREVRAKINMRLDTNFTKGGLGAGGLENFSVISRIFGYGNDEPGHARGVSNWRGGWSWVGEKGPELLNLPSGSRVVPHERSVEMVKEANRRVDFYVHDVNGGLARAGIGTRELAAAISSDADAQSRYEVDF